MALPSLFSKLSLLLLGAAAAAATSRALSSELEDMVAAEAEKGLCLIYGLLGLNLKVAKSEFTKK